MKWKYRHKKNLKVDNRRAKNRHNGLVSTPLNRPSRDRRKSPYRPTGWITSAVAFDFAARPARATISTWEAPNINIIKCFTFPCALPLRTSFIPLINMSLEPTGATEEKEKKFARSETRLVNEWKIWTLRRRARITSCDFRCNKIIFKQVTTIPIIKSMSGPSIYFFRSKKFKILDDFWYRAYFFWKPCMMFLKRLLYGVN